ncbi:hypothetical protein QYF36_023906 [Acer negundo]|nr:hypothetical protein QYF36_023906 [Acer negundo]
MARIMGSRIARPRFSLLGFQRDVGTALAGSEEATVEKMAPAMAVPIHEDMVTAMIEAQQEELKKVTELTLDTTL